MKFGIYTNPNRDPGFIMQDKLLDILQSKGVDAILNPNEFATCDLIIAIGGDGTFLSLAHIESAKNIPCVGINMGSIGFLMEIEVDQVETAVDLLIAGDYEIEERLMIDMKLYDQDGNFLTRSEALNDVVIMREGSSRIITTEFSINGMSVENIPGDGLIVSTPTGSTAYSLAAGGPIVHPSMDVLIITPICPHTLHNRSYLAPGDATIELALIDPDSCAVVSSDGKNSMKLQIGQVNIQKSDRRFLMIRLAGDRFYQRLPQKIQERGNIR